MAQKNAAPRKDEQQQPNRPIAEFRYGLCRTSVWQNQNQDGQTRYSVSLQRSYRDKDGNWQTTQSLNRDDLPLMIQALTDAYRFCYAPRGDSAEE
jgi:hypothetical protein